MAESHTSLPHNIGHRLGQSPNVQGGEDFGFDTPPPLNAPDKGIDAAPPLGGEDFGFDDPIFLGSQQSTMDLSPPRGSEDFGMDALPPGGGEDFGMDTLPPGGGMGGGEDFGMDTLPLGGKEDFGMDGTLQTEAPGPFGSSPKARTWNWGERAPLSRDNEVPVTSGSSNIEARAEDTSEPNSVDDYKTRAAILRAEANRIRRLYLDLQQVYQTDMQLTNVIEEMAQELGLEEL